MLTLGLLGLLCLMCLLCLLGLDRFVELPFSPDSPGGLLLLAAVLELGYVFIAVEALPSADLPHDLSVPQSHLHVILPEVLPSSKQVDISDPDLDPLLLRNFRGDFPRLLDLSHLPLPNLSPPRPTHHLLQLRGVRILVFKRSCQFSLFYNSHQLSQHLCSLRFITHPSTFLEATQIPADPHFQSSSF